MATYSFSIKTNKNTSPNNIILLRDSNKDGADEETETFASGLKQPLECWYWTINYISETLTVPAFIPIEPGNCRWKIGRDTTSYTGGYNNHQFRNIIANKAIDQKLYIHQSGSNVAEHGIESEYRRACIIEINPDGSGERLFATGIRNPAGNRLESPLPALRDRSERTW